MQQTFYDANGLPLNHMVPSHQALQLQPQKLSQEVAAPQQREAVPSRDQPIP